MQRIEINQLDDARIAAYVRLKDKDRVQRFGRFICEGKWLVDRVLASRYEVESLLLEPKLVDRYAADLAAGTQIFVAPLNVIESIVGFNFHRGALACARRPAAAGLQAWPSLRPPRAVVCVDIQNPDNLGGILRNCAAFGVQDVVLLGSCADPFSRRVLRVSMATVLRLNLYVEQDAVAGLTWLRKHLAYDVAAAVLSDRACLLADAPDSQRLALVFGNEAHGLAPRELECCNWQLTIPMRLGTDSLNVATTSGIFLYEFCQRSRPGKPSD